MNRNRFLVVLILTGVAAASAADATLMGDGSDGVRATPVHLIELFDEDGRRIRAADRDPKPFSTRQTCGQCHSYDVIEQGWHFNAHNPDVPAGRPGQPWMLTDLRTRSQIPVTGRPWPGTFTPEEVGLSPWAFMVRFGSHFPGGSYGAMAAEDPEEAIRQNISGLYEINCLACHNADFRQDPSETAMQLARQNYRWAAAGGSGKAAISGVALELSSFFDPEFDDGLKTTYRDGVFDKDDLVYFDIARKPHNSSCYACHSNQDLRVHESHEWMRDEDVHVAAGMNCSDCHRHGLDHQVNRGIEGAEGNAATLSCSGCHLGLEAEAIPQGGRLGAPKPRHAGIPPIHFEKMNCTACHSGTWPDETPGRWRTARMHKLGLHGRHKQDLRLPHVYAPVLLKGHDGKIGAHYLVWPAFWAALHEDAVSPIAPDAVLAAAGRILTAPVETDDDWRPLTEAQVAEVLTLLEAAGNAEPVYLAGGKRYRLAGDGSLVIDIDHPDAAPYAWPMAHDVRPAAQAVGVRSCADCHTTDSPYFFSGVQRDTPIQGNLEFVQMVELQGLDSLFVRVFNASFVFRPMLKAVAFAGCGLIGLVLFIYGLKALVVISRACAQEAE